MSDKEHRFAFNALSQCGEAPLKEAESARQDQDGGCCNEAAGERGVWTNHRVLHRIRNDQDQDEVHAAQLRRFTSADEAEPEEEKEVDDHGAEDDVERKTHERSILPL